MSLIDPPDRKLRVIVLMGGNSSEREVSLSTGKQILLNLDRDKYDVVAFDTLRLADGIDGIRDLILADFSSSAMSEGETNEKASSLANSSETEKNLCKPDIAFVALHGKGGEDGTVQALLEILNIPYTFSGVATSALAMDKMFSKKIFANSNLPIITGLELAGIEFDDIDEEDFNKHIAPNVAKILGFPVFVKPTSGGSTLGCALVAKRADLFEGVTNAWKYDKTVLIEKYVKGVEITVGVLGMAGNNLTVLPIVEIVPKGAFYDYESKYSDGGSQHVIPARISEELTALAQEIAVECHNVLKCSGCSRTDMIVVRDKIHLIETNTIPGMTPTSLLPQAAAAAGISFPELLDILIDFAWNAERKRLKRIEKIQKER